MKLLIKLSLIIIPLLCQACIFEDGGKDKDLTYTVTGSVQGNDGTGIEGTSVSLQGTTADNEILAPYTVLSDSGGNFVFEGLSNGSYSVVPELHAYRFAPSQLSVVIDGESVRLSSLIATPFLPDEYAEYTITFTSTWSAESHPLDFPTAPHFSPIIGAYHGENVVFWEEGSLASPGIKDVAEKGRRDMIKEEILEAIDSGDANVLLWGGGIATSPGSVEITFTAQRDFHYVTLVSMIAPSPDWFIGVSGLDLFDTDDWVGNMVFDLYVYDAGTDSGKTYTAQNSANTVPETIRKIDDYAFVSDDNIIPVGTMTFTRTENPDVGNK
ncbi:spondin domain-containing protein [Candidatus Latescibacterota bacterium]